MENLKLSNLTEDDLDELLEAPEGSRESDAFFARGKDRADLKMQLEALAQDTDSKDSVSVANTEFGVAKEKTGIKELLEENAAEAKDESAQEEAAEDPSPAEEAPKSKAGGRQQEEAPKELSEEQSDEYEPERAERLRAVETIKDFNEKAEIKNGKAGKDALMDNVQNSVSAYVDVTDKETMLGHDKASLNEDAVDNALGRLQKLERACSEYIEKKNPLLKTGRKKKNAVRSLKGQLQNLKEEKEGFEETYEDLYLPSPALRKDEDKGSGGMGDDDGKKKKTDVSWEELDKGQQSFVKGTSAMGAYSVLPFEISESGDAVSADSTGYMDYTELSADRRLDEVKLSDNARMQLTVVKTIGFLFGVADWQQIVDPEELLYNEDNGEVKNIRISIVPGMFGDVSDKINDADGKHFAESLKGDPEGIKMLDAFLKQKVGSVQMLEAATGIKAATIYKRLLSIRRYLKDVLKQ